MGKVQQRQQDTGGLHHAQVGGPGVGPSAVVRLFISPSNDVVGLRKRSLPAPDCSGVARASSTGANFHLVWPQMAAASSRQPGWPPHLGGLQKHGLAVTAGTVAPVWKPLKSLVNRPTALRIRPGAAAPSPCRASSMSSVSTALWSCAATACWRPDRFTPPRPR